MEKELANAPSASASNSLPVSNCQKVIIKHQYFLPQGSSGERNCSTSSSRGMSLEEDKGPNHQSLLTYSSFQSYLKKFGRGFIGVSKSTFLSALSKWLFYHVFPHVHIKLYIFISCVCTHLFMYTRTLH